MISKKKIRVVELFAGVGGFRLGLEACDKQIYDTIWASQWEPNQAGQWAYKCYSAHFGEGSCSNKDIATVIDEVPPHDLLVGGFPCQDYSVAHSLSTSHGIEGKKGVLWWSINDIVKLHHPNYILLENVDRLLKSPAKQRGRDFGIILKCLLDEGYAVEWRVINASNYGCVQRRRRTFIFACHNNTKHYSALKEQIFIGGADKWLSKDGFFAKPFPVLPSTGTEKTTISTLENYSDLVEITDSFSTSFYNSGVMVDGKIFTREYVANGEAPAPLSSIVLNEALPEKYFITPDALPKWEYMKGSKRIERISKTGYSYNFSEGPIAFPDPLDKPARTMLTSEGTKNRSSHVIQDPYTNRLRILTPEECELINGFPRGWTDTAMPERQRYFIMGNALVVPLIEKMAERLLEIR